MGACYIDRVALRCPICSKEVLPREENEAFPFCRSRCRLIDLGKWLGEEYRLPGRPVDDTAAVPGDDDGTDGGEPH